MKQISLRKMICSCISTSFSLFEVAQFLDLILICLFIIEFAQKFHSPT